MCMYFVKPNTPLIIYITFMSILGVFTISLIIYILSANDPLNVFQTPLHKILIDLSLYELSSLTGYQLQMESHT
jgi:hypothetical protein